MRLERGNTYVVCSLETVTDPYVPTWAYKKTYSPDGVRKTMKSGRIFQRGNPWSMHYSHQQAPRSWKSGRAAVDSVACPSTFKVKWAETQDFPTYARNKIQRRTMMPKEVHNFAHNNKSDQRLRLLVGSLSSSPLARPYSFSFPPSLPEKKFVVLVWDNTTG